MGVPSLEFAYISTKPKDGNNKVYRQKIILCDLLSEPLEKWFPKGAASPPPGEQPSEYDLKECVLLIAIRQSDGCFRKE